MIGFLCRALFGLMFVVAVAGADPARAQDQAWVQIEAQPSLREAEVRARAYSGAFANVNGFRLPTGWYAIALGPYSPAEAARQLDTLRGDRLIPGDSYIVDGDDFGQRFWPVAAGINNRPAPETPLPDAAPAPAPVEETIAEARASESALTAQERATVQEALRWAGFYDAAIDGAFGPGTRTAMASWQAANGRSPTGVLTSGERDELLSGFRIARETFGFETVRDEAAGVEIALPLALVSFDRFEAPFAIYSGGDGVEVRLISQRGGQDALASLYDTLQSLEFVPAGGFRRLEGDSFVLSSEDGRIRSHTVAVQDDGVIRGYSLVMPLQNGDMDAVLEAMQRSFAPFGSHGLEDMGAAPTDEERTALLGGLDLQPPLRTRSGFYIDQEGLVLTSADAAAGCGRVVLDETHEASVVFSDEALGVAVLQPTRRMVPRGVAAFRVTPPQAGAMAAAAGYSFGEVMTLPTLTLGEVASQDASDRNGSRLRLSISTFEGDAGGPVFDEHGAVLGLLLPRDEGSARLLPQDMAFAATGAEIAGVLEARGLQPGQSEGTEELAPAELARRAGGMTVLVSCQG